MQSRQRYIKPTLGFSGRLSTQPDMEYIFSALTDSPAAHCNKKYKQMFDTHVHVQCTKYDATLEFSSYFWMV